MVAVARLIPIQWIYIPFILISINPKICSTRARILDFSRLFAFCSSVSGRLRAPFYHVIHLFSGNDFFLWLAAVRRISVKIFAFVLFVQQLICNLRIVYAGVSDVILDKRIKLILSFI